VERLEEGGELAKRLETGKLGGEEEE